MPDVPGERRVEGTLETVDEYGVTVRTSDGERALKYGEIRTARTVFAWGPTPKKGGSTPRVKKSKTKGQPA